MSELISIAKGSLSSRVVRNLIGERTIDLFSELVHSGGGGGAGDLIGFIFSLGQKLTGFLVGLVEAGIGWLLKNLMDILVQTAYTIAYFDWNQTDTAIEEQIKNNNAFIGNSLGFLAGTSLVWLTGLTISAGLSIEFPVVAGRVALALSEEGGSQIRGTLMNFLLTARDMVAQNIVLKAFLTARQMKLFGLTEVKEDKKPWTIAQNITESINKFSHNEFVKQFLQGLLLSAEQSLIAMGYCISYTLDDWYSNHLAAHKQALGQEKTVILVPNQETPDEKILLSSPQEIATEQITQTLATHQLVYNRDIGLVVGQSADEYAKASYRTRKLVIVFKAKSKPPWKDAAGNIVQEVVVTIPDVKNGLSWETLKIACASWEWGKYQATLRLANNSLITVWAASESVARDKAKEFATLTTQETLAINVLDEVDRPVALKKNPTKIYPAYATLLIKSKTSSSEGQADITGQRWKKTSLRVDLWCQEPPSNANQLD